MPILINKDEWSRIVKWTDHDREDPEVVRRREYVKYLDSKSKEMTKSWPNSVENVNKRNEELRRERIEAAEKANAEFYKSYIKKKKEEQQRMMASARETIFKNKDAPKLLLSSVIETVIQKERMEQLKFQEKLRQIKAEQKKKNDDEIIAKAKQWNKLIELKKKRRFDANKQHQKEITEQANEIAERNRKEYETELNLQKIDNIKADEQMTAIKKFEENFKASEKARIWSDMERSRQESEARRNEQAARERLDDKLLEVLLRSRARIERRRAQTELDVKNEKLRVLEKISQRLESGDAAREQHEQAILNKAIKEKSDAEEARRRADIEKQKQFRQQRQEAREQFLRDEEKRLQDFNTLRQWEIMNRFKNAELYHEFNENKRKEKARKTQEYKEDILRLWKERSDREAQELADTRYFYGELAEQNMRAEDEKLLEHAASLVLEAQQNGRPDYAIRKAVDRYCRMRRLYPLPALPASLAAHYPSPSAPPAPLPALAPPLRRHGLQEPVEANTSKTPNEEPNVESVAEYKRLGPANGLQRRTSTQNSNVVRPCEGPALGGDGRCSPSHVTSQSRVAERCRCDTTNQPRK
ncbi:trichohyalin [Bombyx mori]|uniref:Trichohyalin-plectin-homology domain-containing protein n=1 Tax=Bombyx mori TaxID=7091 RepID=A0A8R2M9S5_BOMMO|nr:trichohyalin [Bombyx mori]